MDLDLFALSEQLRRNPFFLLFLMIGVFELSVWVRHLTKQPLVNPTLITTVVVIAVLNVLNIEWQSFEQASNYLTFWLQPVVVCLAVPLYMQWQKIKAQWLPVLVSQLVGSIVGIVSGVGILRLLGGSYDSLVATAAKSVTMPIAIEVTTALGGRIGIAAATVLVAGVVGQVVGVYLLHCLRVRQPMAIGIALGTASHALGTVRAMQLGKSYVAYASLGLILNGVLTAFLAPILVPWLI